MFHPYEIALCGPSGSGKTTLMEKLIRHFSEAGYEVAALKHGCHRFDLDREGKDSDRFTKAGAIPVMISDREKEALISKSTGRFDTTALALSADHLFIEGLKELPVQKLLFADPASEMIPLLENDAIPEVLGLVHDGNAEGLERFAHPLFDRNDVGAVSAFIAGNFEKRTAAIALHGLVLAGGRSSRMGQDKALLRYHPQNQLERTASLLSAVCDRVFVSCRNEQLDDYAGSGLPAITDSYLDMGPLGALLSAQRLHPDAAWLIAACDLPLIDESTLTDLLKGRNPYRYATAFATGGKSRPEPLLAVYEPKSRRRLLERHAGGDDSLRSFLMQSRISLTETNDPATLFNANDPEAFAETRYSIGKDDRA